MSPELSSWVVNEMGCGFRETYSRSELENMSDIGVISVAKGSDPVISKESMILAKEVLWKRWEPFTYKSYIKGLEGHEKVGLDSEDYMQEAYLYFEWALAQFSLEKAKKNNLKCWSTWFFMYVRNIYNNTEQELSRFGVPIYTSQFDDEKEGGEKTFYEKEFEKVTSSDNREEDGEAVGIVRGYRSSVKDPDVRDILDLMVSGMTAKGISNNTGIDVAVCKQKMSMITKELRVYAVDHGYVPDNDHYDDNEVI